MPEILTTRKSRSPAAAALLASLAAAASPRRRRTMRRFAEDEFVHPTGPYAGRRFRVERQPFTGLWLDEVDSGRWPTCFATGPTQSSKTTLVSLIPLVYHLFEIGEDLIFGLPDANMASDKWERDVKPVIEASRYRELLPTRGDGSRDGRSVTLIRFGNGARMRFMAAGGGDKQRAGFTARVLIVTEVDGFDTTAGNSVETDKFGQLCGRLRVYREDVRRLYGECTLTTKDGRTFREISEGTDTRIACPCVHCGAWVTPGREHLVGWQGADSLVTAKAQAAFACPACGAELGEAARKTMNAAGVLVHRGQTVSGPAASPTLTGLLPPTRTFGLTWNPFNNLFLNAADVAADEWKAKRSPDEDAAERMLRQFVWALPYVPEETEGAELTWDQVAARANGAAARGVVPADAVHLTAFMDLGKFVCHWVLLATLADGSPHVVDYGLLETEWDAIGEERALLIALRQFRDLCAAGWPVAGVAGEQRRRPTAAGIDSGNWTTWCYAFIREAETQSSPLFWFPAKGFGLSVVGRKGYHAPAASIRTPHRGPGYHTSWQAADGVLLLDVDADYWKTWVHARARTPRSEPGALTLFAAAPKEHLTFARHLCAERRKEQYDAKAKKLLTGWVNVHGRPNHYLDALANAGVLAHLSGARLPGEEPAAPAPQTGRRRAGVRRRN